MGYYLKLMIETYQPTDDKEEVESRLRNALEELRSEGMAAVVSAECIEEKDVPSVNDLYQRTVSSIQAKIAAEKEFGLDY